MEALMYRDDIPVELILNKALKDTIAQKKELDYYESLKVK